MPSPRVVRFVFFDAALVEVPYAKDQVKDAPNVDMDAGGHLSEQEEERLYQYYGINWDAASQDVRSGTGQATGTTDDAMTRSEEEMHIGVERREAGRARLRKYVVTEEQQYTVPVRHEEVRVEREPISDTNRDRAMAGPDITEAEHDVTLYEEQPVVETQGSTEGAGPPDHRGGHRGGDRHRRGPQGTHRNRGNRRAGGPAAPPLISTGSPGGRTADPPSRASCVPVRTNKPSVGEGWPGVSGAPGGRGRRCRPTRSGSAGRRG